MNKSRVSNLPLGEHPVNIIIHTRKFKVKTIMAPRRSVVAVFGRPSVFFANASTQLRSRVLL